MSIVSRFFFFQKKNRKYKGNKNYSSTKYYNEIMKFHF